MTALAVPSLAVASSASAEDDCLGIEFGLTAEARAVWMFTVKPLIGFSLFVIGIFKTPALPSHLIFLILPAVKMNDCLSLYGMGDDFDRLRGFDDSFADRAEVGTLVVVEERNLAAHRAVLKGFASHSLATRATLNATLFTEPVVVLVEVSTRGWLVAVAADVKGHLLLGAVAWGDGVPGGGALQFFPRTFTQE